MTSIKQSLENLKGTVRQEDQERERGEFPGLNIYKFPTLHATSMHTYNVIRTLL